MGTLASGQVAASDTALWTGTGPLTGTVDAIFFNTSASLTETVLVKLAAVGGANAERVVARAVLAPHEQLVIRGLPMSLSDVLSAQATDASTVDYTVTIGGNELQLFSLDANGNQKTTAAAIAGSQTISGKLTAQELSVGPAPTDTFSASMSIDVTKGFHVISASHTTSATVTLTPSAAGTAGDLLTILTETDSSGTVTATFASTFHSSGTQATTSSTFSSITFQSDGTRWIELCRTTAMS